MRYLPSVIAFITCLSVAMPVAAETQFTRLQPAGRGEIRYLGVIKVYDAELFTSPDATVDEVQKAETDFCLALTYNVELSADKFALAAEKILERQWSDEQLAPMRGHIDEFHASYRNVKKGDHYTLCYNTDKHHTRLALNGEILAQIDSADFARLYSGIWMSDNNPIDSKLKAELLKPLQERGNP